MFSSLNSCSSESADIADHAKPLDKVSVHGYDSGMTAPKPLNDLSSPEISQRSVLVPIRKRVLTILFIGETGSGKTTLLSLIFNFLHGKGPLDLRDYHDLSCESGLATTESQTTRAKLYSIITPDDTMIQILDTPGLGDTRGIEQDNKHKKEIHTAIREFVTTIDAVMIIANGTNERLNVVTDYTLNVISAMFPQSLIDNIGFLFTNSEKLTFNFKMGGLRSELRHSKSWLIQNPIAMLKNYRNLEEQLTGQPKGRSGSEWKISGHYNEALEALNEWMVWLDERQVQPTKEITRLHIISTDIESKIEAAYFCITHLTKQRAEYEKIRAGLQDVREQKDNIEALKQQRTSPVWYREPTEDTNEICLASGCYSNCELSCYTRRGERLMWRYWPGWGPIVRYSESRAVCKVCDHEQKHHVRYNIRHAQKSQASVEVLTLFEKAEDKEQELRMVKRLVDEELERINREISSTRESIHSLVDEFNHISISKNFVGHLNSAIDVLKLRKGDLKGNPNAATEIALIDESIKTFEEKIRVLAGNGSGWLSQATDVARGVNDAARALDDWYNGDVSGS